MAIAQQSGSGWSRPKEHEPGTFGLFGAHRRNSELCFAQSGGRLMRRLLVATWLCAGMMATVGAHGAPAQRAYLTLRGQMANTTVGPFSVSGVFRAIESKKNVRLRDIVIRGVTATDLGRDGIRIRGDVDGVEISQFQLRMRDLPQRPPNLPIGIAVQQGRRISISDGQISGFQMSRTKGAYTNGDGIATEREVTGLRIARVTSTDNSDGGFDLKSRDTSLDQLTSARNGRNYRFWGSVEANKLTSVDPRNAHVWIAKGASVHIRNLTAQSRSRAPLMRIEGPSVVIVDRCSLHLPPGTQLVVTDHPGGKLSLGSGCRVS
jgi:hypothetical protein